MADALANDALDGRSVCFLQKHAKPYVRGSFDGGCRNRSASSAWILEAADNPHKTWVLAGQEAIVFEGSSTKAELLAACLLHCAFA